MDYIELEHLQQHRQNGRRGGRRTQVEAGFGGEGSAAMAAGADDVMLGRGLLRRGSQSIGTQFFSPCVRMYSNATPATGDRRMAHRSQRRSRPSQLRTGKPPSPNPTSLQHGHRGSSNGIAGGSQRRTASRPSRKQGLWSNDDLQQALATFDDGVSMRKAAVTYNIPYSTFREWCYGIRTSRKKGPPSVLKPAEEEELVAYLIQMCDRGFGLSPTALRMKVYEITQSRWTPFRNGILGNGWMRWWKRRHPKLTLRVSQALESARARGLCEENVRTFYENLQQLYDLHKYYNTHLIGYGTTMNLEHRQGEMVEQLLLLEEGHVEYKALCQISENGYLF